MASASKRAELVVLTWPTFAWVTAWQLMIAPAAPVATRKPARKPARKRRARHRAEAEILHFPQERVLRRATFARPVEAEIIRLPETA
jgi:hypothetical protein